MTRTAIAIAAILSLGACAPTYAERQAKCEKDSHLASPGYEQDRYDLCMAGSEPVHFDWGGLAGAVGDGLSNYANKAGPTTGLTQSAQQQPTWVQKVGPDTYYVSP
jgi:hypothetical protein